MEILYAAALFLAPPSTALSIYSFLPTAVRECVFFSIFWFTLLKVKIFTFARKNYLTREMIDWFRNSTPAGGWWSSPFFYDFFFLFFS